MCQLTVSRGSQKLLSDFFVYFSLTRPCSQDHALLQGRLGNMASIRAAVCLLKIALLEKKVRMESREQLAAPAARIYSKNRF